MMNTWSFDNYKNERELRRQEGKEIGAKLLMEISDILNWSKNFLTTEQLNHFLLYDVKALMMHEAVSFTKAFNNLTKDCFQWLCGEKEALRCILELKWNALKDIIAKTEDGVKLYPDGMLGIYQRNINQIYTALKTKPKYSSFTIPWVNPDLFLVLIRTGFKQLMN